MAILKTKKRPPGRPKTGQMPQHQIRCRNEDWELLQRAAEIERLETSAWIRHVALKAAKRILQRQDAR